MKFISAYSKKTKPKSITYPPTKTKQSMKEECDINKIIYKYSKIGVVEHINNNQQTFGDVTDVDFQQSLNLVIEAQNSFDALPSQIRKRFSNDPSELLAFLSDKKNLKEAVELGLVPPREDGSADGTSGEPPQGGSAARSDDVEPPKGGDKTPKKGAESAT